MKVNWCVRASQADVNVTINVTQLTELVVNNIAGQIASYFENGDFGSVSTSVITTIMAGFMRH